MRVVYPGAPGAFSHEACLRFLPAHEPVPVASFAEVIEAIQGGASELGMLPLANNEAGDTGARALIDAAGLHIVEEAVLPIHVHLLGLPSTTADRIRTVVSHPIALRQCARSLSDLRVKTEEAANTAIAAKALASPERGVLASEASASLYNLAILMRDMHDRPDNATTFAIIARSDA